MDKRVLYAIAGMALVGLLVAFLLWFAAKIDPVAPPPPSELTSASLGERSAREPGPLPPPERTREAPSLGPRADWPVDHIVLAALPEGMGRFVVRCPIPDDRIWRMGGSMPPLDVEGYAFHTTTKASGQAVIELYDKAAYADFEARHDVDAYVVSADDEERLDKRPFLIAWTGAGQGAAASCTVGETRGKAPVTVIVSNLEALQPVQRRSVQLTADGDVRYVETFPEGGQLADEAWVGVDYTVVAAVERLNDEGELESWDGERRVVVAEGMGPIEITLELAGTEEELSEPTGESEGWSGVREYLADIFASARHERTAPEVLSRLDELEAWAVQSIEEQTQRQLEARIQEAVESGELELELGPE